MVAISSFDTSEGQNARLKVEAIDITTKGFYIRVSTWYDSKTYSVSVPWLAYGDFL